MIVDKRGDNLSREQLIERIALYDLYCLIKGLNADDFTWGSKIMRQGHRGIESFTDKQLIIEWKYCEDGFFNMLALGEEPYPLEFDPQFKMAKVMKNEKSQNYN
jgi:hypothetical protein|tara:strand:- start:870 stop:1181 length:312 start_codon:yes stop_codon:yes gene_type:complete